MSLAQKVTLHQDVRCSSILQWHWTIMQHRRQVRCSLDEGVLPTALGQVPLKHLNGWSKYLFPTITTSAVIYIFHVKYTQAISPNIVLPLCLAAHQTACLWATWLAARVGEGRCSNGRGSSARQSALPAITSKAHLFDIIKKRCCQLCEYQTEPPPSMGSDPPPRHCPLMADRNPTVIFMCWEALSIRRLGLPAYLLM